jgi:hypothetical protein
MSPQLTLTLRRAGAFGLLLALLAVLWFGIAQPVMGYLDRRAEQRGIDLRALKRDRALLREEPVIRAALASVEQSSRWRNFYDGRKADAATLQLQTDLRTLFQDTGNPTSMSTEPATIQGGVTRIAVRVTLLMHIDELANALDRLQKQPRQLRIESLSIQAPNSQSPQTNPVLTVRAEIAAWMVDLGAERS